MARKPQMKRKVLPENNVNKKRVGNWDRESILASFDLLFIGTYSAHNFPSTVC